MFAHFKHFPVLLDYLFPLPLHFSLLHTQATFFKVFNCNFHVKNSPSLFAYYNFQFTTLRLSRISHFTIPCLSHSSCRGVWFSRPPSQSSRDNFYLFISLCDKAGCKYHVIFWKFRKSIPSFSKHSKFLW